MADIRVVDPERSSALQKYLELQSQQQDLIRRRLSASSSTSSSTVATSPTSPMSSPYYATSQPLTITPAHFSSTCHHHRRSSSFSDESPLLPHETPLSPDSSSTPLFPHENPIPCTLSTSSNPTDYSLSASLEGEEAALMELTQNIKAQLTTLLNLPSVRRGEQSSEWRTWVQERLMDAEVELRRLRKANCRCSPGGC